MNETVVAADQGIGGLIVVVVILAAGYYFSVKQGLWKGFGWPKPKVKKDDAE